MFAATCIHCQKPFQHKHYNRQNTAKFCSIYCYNTYRHILYFCMQCQKPFHKCPAKIKSGARFCSSKCSNIYRKIVGEPNRPKLLTCLYCNENFRPSRNRDYEPQFCSLACSVRYRIKPIDKRFWSKVNIVKNRSSCWVWNGALSSLGYGSFNFNGVTKRAHRISYEFTYGPILPSIHVLHQCDNSRCVRPSHLKLGGNSDNMRDAWERGRSKRKPWGSSRDNGSES